MTLTHTHTHQLLCHHGVSPSSLTQDIVEYVNMVCSGFLANLSLVIQSCYDMFVKRNLIRYSVCVCTQYMCMCNSSIA